MYKIKRTTITTHKYLFNYILHNYNPNDFEKPDMNINSKTLIDVFKNGNLCFYKKDIGLYLYQYNGKLYWVASRDFNFNENGLTYIIYHIFTSQYDKLPEDRINYKDNLDFYFEDYEITEEDTTTYRVTVHDIPSEYAITYITTGVFDNVNDSPLWLNSFYLDNLNQNIDNETGE